MAKNLIIRDLPEDVQKHLDRVKTEMWRYNTNTKAAIYSLRQSDRLKKDLNAYKHKCYMLESRVKQLENALNSYLDSFKWLEKASKSPKKDEYDPHLDPNQTFIE